MKTTIKLKDERHQPNTVKVADMPSGSYGVIVNYALRDGTLVLKCCGDVIVCLNTGQKWTCANFCVQIVENVEIRYS